MRLRKDDHIRICIEEEVEAGDPGFEFVRLKNLTCPQTSLEHIDTSVEFLGKKMQFPIIIEAMTGGTSKAKKINTDLATVAQEYGIGMGVGSQRSAMEDASLEWTFQVRDIAPDIPLIGNLGAVQLNYGYGTKECEKAVKMTGADALVCNIHPL